MALLTDVEIKEAKDRGEIDIDPWDDKSIQGASYDIKLGKRGIISKSVTIEELRKKIQAEELKELNIEREESISIPGGAFALVMTNERIKLSQNYAGHIGMRSYYIRKGLTLLSGLQIDPGWDAPLVLGFVNLSPRTITLDYKDHICTIEIHKLNRDADKVYDSTYMAEQREGRIPSADKDYLRTIETMSVTDLTEALIKLTESVESTNRWVRGFWYGIGILILIAIVSLIFTILGSVPGSGSG